jgi:3-dehydroquinate synthase
MDATRRQGGFMARPRTIRTGVASIVRVELAERSYDIVIKDGLLPGIGRRLKALGLSGGGRRGKAAIVTNPQVNRLYGRVVAAGIRDAGFEAVVLTVPDGEAHKGLKEASSLYDRLIAGGMERGSPIIALGGGVIGDLAGFVAATYLRGVPYIQAPTTLLAQVDSSVGGKTAVNHPLGKNLIGAFYQPRAVFIDPLVLKTLKPREMRAGLAEVVKYGVIRDPGFFAFLEANSASLNAPGAALRKAIERSCAVKAEVVSSDEREGGLRAILNFGHTFGHAIESVAGYGTFRHGEAVSMGMVMASRFSAWLGLCPGETAERVAGLLLRTGLPVEAPRMPADALLRSMQLDKKVKGARLRFVLVEKIGGVVLREVDSMAVRAFLSGTRRDAGRG